MLPGFFVSDRDCRKAAENPRPLSKHRFTLSEILAPLRRDKTQALAFFSLPQQNVVDTKMAT